MPDMKEHTVTEWMWPRDVADAFGVTPRTVTAWADAGRIPVYVMPSGHRRYKRADVERILEEAGTGACRTAGLEGRQREARHPRDLAAPPTSPSWPDAYWKRATS